MDAGELRKKPVNYNDHSGLKISPENLLKFLHSRDSQKCYYNSFLETFPYIWEFHLQVLLESFPEFLEEYFFLSLISFLDFLEWFLVFLPRCLSEHIPRFLHKFLLRLFPEIFAGFLQEFIPSLFSTWFLEISAGVLLPKRLVMFILLSEFLQFSLGFVQWLVPRILPIK